MLQAFIDAFSQVFAVLLLALVSWSISVFVRRRRKMSSPNFFSFIGLHIKGFSWGREFTRVFAVSLGLGALGTLLSFYFVEGYGEFVKSDSSPYWRILKNGFNAQAVGMAAIYCGLQAGLSEEILFRGLISKRLIGAYGFNKGNIAQALIFWLLHFVLVGGVTGAWISLLQLTVLATIFPIALLMGYANERLSGGSLVASWLIHGGMNFVTFFLLAYYLL